MYKLVSLLILFFAITWLTACDAAEVRNATAGSSSGMEYGELNRPNILIAISDDQSYPHAGIYGDLTVQTPTFDRLAREGVLFHNAFAASPGCAPSRSSIHTGRFPWQNEEAGGHQTLFPLKYVTYPDVLEDAGYFIGFTGKSVSPFNWQQSFRERNPAGVDYNHIVYTREERDTFPSSYLSRFNYAANFEKFIEDRPDGQPFYFWYGAQEPHRAFEDGSGLRSGKRLEDVKVPGFFPDHEVVRSDILDYALHIDWFDMHLSRMIEKLEEIGELDNTLIIVTSDQGMAFPRAKSNMYDYGLRVPLAVFWPERIPGGREVHDLISLADIAPTLLDITQTEPGPMLPMSAKSFSDILFSDRTGLTDPEREAVFAGRERHSSARWAHLGYPMRSVRTHDYLYIHNFAPERWPAGAPQILNPDNIRERYHMHGLDENGKFTGEAYFDIDASPTKSFMIEHHNTPEYSRFYELAMGKRPADELYDIKNDPYNLHNLAGDPAYAEALEDMRNRLFSFLRETEDPRVVGPVPDVFENYQRFSRLRAFPRPDWMTE